MERQKKVVDASIAVKWFTNEKDTSKALTIRDAHINGEIVIIVPDLIFLEALNALKYKKLDKESLNNVNENLWDLQLHVEKMNSYILDKAISISLEYDLTLYDSMYAAIAQLHGCQLVTTDEKLKKFPSAITL